MISNVLSKRVSDVDFGIIPHPKLDEAQENYYSNINAYAGHLISVPITTPDPDRTGFILEAMVAAGMHIITPAFYDVQLTTKSTRDNESGEMLDIIFANQLYDVGYSFAWGNAVGKVMDAYNTRNENLTSVLASITKTADKDVQNTAALFAEE